MLPLHRSHDYAGLIRRWKSLARPRGLSWRIYSEIDGFPLFVFENRRSLAGGKNIYLSAGIHGDEPASTEGLLDWAGKNTDVFRQANFTIFPCLNPWGLINNCRFDAQGNDLNRSFHEDVIPSIRDQKILVPDDFFHLGLTLHEDFDGQGLYIYEVDPGEEIWSPRLLQSIEKIIAIDERRTIDRHRVTQPGYLCRRPGRQQIVKGPEALFLHQKHAQHVFTIETPSEFALDTRIAAHSRLVETAVHRTVTGRWTL